MTTAPGQCLVAKCKAQINGLTCRSYLNMHQLPLCFKMIALSSEETSQCYNISQESFSHCHNHGRMCQAERSA